MGFAPLHVDRMTAWQFQACLDGLSRENQNENEPVETDDDILQRMEIVGVEG
jgi:hypothetical protein